MVNFSEALKRGPRGSSHRRIRRSSHKGKMEKAGSRGRQ